MAERNFDDASNKNHTLDAAQCISGGGMLVAAVPVLADAIVLFWLFPGLDLWASRLLYLGNHDFIGAHSTALSLTRAFFNATFVLACFLSAVGLIITSTVRRQWFSISFRKWLFLAICLGVGPGIVANLGLKDHWGRARPHHVVEFGGTKKFSSPIHPSDQCDRHCSFVSGEASSIFIIFFAAALMFKTWSRTFVTLGIIFGSAAGFVRMAQGGHFLSDVVFAGILMALTAAIISLVFDSVMAEARSVRP